MGRVLASLRRMANFVGVIQNQISDTLAVKFGTYLGTGAIGTCSVFRRRDLAEVCALLSRSYFINGKRVYSGLCRTSFGTSRR